MVLQIVPAVQDNDFFLVTYGPLVADVVDIISLASVSKYSASTPCEVHLY